MASDISTQPTTLFANPFHIEDLLVFDDETLQTMLACGAYGVHTPLLAQSLQGASASLVQHILDNLPQEHRERFQHELSCPASQQTVEQARQQVLDAFFWELIYWKKPELYEELTEGERLHPGIFARLQPDLHAKTVLDAGAGSGRASFECLRAGAAQVYAVEPSPGLLRLLRRKLLNHPDRDKVIARAGRFDALPLEDKSVDIALSCSAFTAMAEQGGDLGLAELIRVTKPGGKIIIVWPRLEDHEWFEAHGFQYVSLSNEEEMRVYFRSLETALHCARLFYAHNPRVMRYILTLQRPEIPFSVIGINPPCDYYWYTVPSGDASS